MKVGNSARLPFATTLTGHNLTRKQAYSDFQMTKQYWWSAGVAGFRGTIVNWVETLVDWNPGLDEDLASEWFSNAFDYPMPADLPGLRVRVRGNGRLVHDFGPGPDQEDDGGGRDARTFRTIRGTGALRLQLVDPLRTGPGCSRRCETRARRGTVISCTTAFRPTTGTSSGGTARVTLANLLLPAKTIAKTPLPAETVANLPLPAETFPYLPLPQGEGWGEGKSPIGSSPTQ